MGRLTGKLIVITGGTAGIGRSAALLSAADGAYVVIAGRDWDRGAAVVDEIERAGGKGRFVRCDVQNDSEVKSLAGEAADRSGQIDVWINNAGTEGQVGPLAEVGDDSVDTVLRTNVKGVYSGIRHALPLMPSDGTIVNVASFVGTRVPVPIAIAYGASKAAVVSMTSSTAAAVGEDGPLVVAVCPWVVDTPMVDRLTGGAADDKADFAAGFAPSGSLTSPEDVAQVITGICARELKMEPGAAVLVDAGPTVSEL